MPPLRILLADDHEILRRGLRTLLEAQAGWEVVGEARTGRETVGQVKQLKPDVVVLDVTMPELNGLEVTRQIRKMAPEVAVLVLTAHESEQLAEQLLGAGALGYLLKSDAARDLPTAVDSVSRGKTFFTSKIGRLVLEGYLKTTSRPASKGTLTESEREIVQLLAEGKSNKEVADLKGIAVKTAETHRANIMRKLGLHSISDLVRYAVRNGFIEP